MQLSALLIELSYYSLPRTHPCQRWHESLQSNEIRKMNSNLIVIGKTTNENDKEDFDNEADDDDADNAEESEGEEFEQETS